MSTEPSRRLVRSVRERAGRAFRGAGYYDPDRLELFYRRDDLDPESFRDRAEEVRRRALERRPLAEEGGPLGRRRAAMELYEGVVLLQIPAGDDAGVVLSLEAEVAGNIGGFVDDCRASLGLDDSSRSPPAGDG